MTGILCNLCTVYILAIFGRIIFSWIPIAPNSPVAAVRTFLVTITEPVMGPLRRALPPVRFGGFAMDLSPIIVLILLQAVVMGAILKC
ncbi:MAG: YggT family protein [Actinomycetota bacterium]|nr:YggT family protein [Actinomycetota bacterium]